MVVYLVGVNPRLSGEDDGSIARYNVEGDGVDEELLVAIVLDDDRSGTPCFFMSQMNSKLNVEAS